MEQQNVSTRHIVLALIVASFFVVSTTSQSPDCRTVLLSLAPCLDYIKGISLSPSTGCCTQLTNVVETQPQCLCEALNGGGGSSLGISINQTQAMALPSACKVETPPVSKCSTIAPAASPTHASSASSGSSSKSVPTLTQGSSSTKLSLSLLLSLLFVAAYASSVIISA